jgi:hypothetical protein
MVLTWIAELLAPPQNGKAHRLQARSARPPRVGFHNYHHPFVPRLDMILSCRWATPRADGRVSWDREAGVGVGADRAGSRSQTAGLSV